MPRRDLTREERLELSRSLQRGATTGKTYTPRKKKPAPSSVPPERSRAQSFERDRKRSAARARQQESAKRETQRKAAQQMTAEELRKFKEQQRRAHEAAKRRRARS